ncbi:hypothetical protein CKO44_16145 [Rubrivivax gelatinosus]|uniref:phage BR0599 family protein n=1 Tax=Rubrivivax gelatinosus TaxID=28068 RepID=UPI00190417FE|nr:phage BR0599 family protein [Rubrivivax gelatinosus]MBK1615001.1 hypothetical protein [Rubrivivax gelatinosus]MBZ8143016.1 hypothetical protein [Rubrivivax gelatinosus]
MSYDARERSVHGGSPVELYLFTIGSVVWRYTSSARTITVDGAEWTAAPLKRGSIETSQEAVRNGLDVECARDFPVAQLFRVSPPSDPIGLIIRRYHRDDAEITAAWIGKVMNCEWQPGEGKATLHGESATSARRRAGPGRVYQRGCHRPLFEQGCPVVKAEHSITTTVTSIAGLQLGVAALLARPYAGGWIEWTRPSGFVDRRFILAGDALQLTLTLPLQGLAVGDSVTVLPGCDNTTETCASVYGALDAHGGFPHVPGINPFGAAPIF